MTLADAHSVHEQLPFAYLFQETLCAARLEASLQRLLSSTLAILGGRIVIRDDRPVILYGQATDGVLMSFGTSSSTLQEFQDQLDSQATEEYSTSAWNPTRVSPLCDPLSAKGEAWLLSSAASLASVRITYPHQGGTIVGLNLSHALADTASCLVVAACWGREMRGLRSPETGMPSHERWRATTTGMISPLQAELFSAQWSLAPAAPSPWAAPLYDWMTATTRWSRSVLGFPPTKVRAVPLARPAPPVYTYVGLAFPLALQRAMKAYGLAQGRPPPDASFSSSSPPAIPYVSKNDMVTAYGWLLQRTLSGRGDWSVSVVVNLRGKGVDGGLFGNGIANVIASLPAGQSIRGGGGSVTNVTKKEVHTAAGAIRHALLLGMQGVPEQLALSQMGRPRANTTTSPAFSTTSWNRLAVWDDSIRFSHTGRGLFGFYGLPVHPLPADLDTFAGVIVPTQDGGCIYHLLTPSNFEAEARAHHQHMGRLFADWEKGREKENVSPSS
jgi:hypothetical protein